MRQTRPMTYLLAALMVALPLAAAAQAPTVLPADQPLRLAWDAGDSQPPDEAYKVRLLAQSSPSGVTITEIVTPTASTTFDVPYAALPDQPFWVSVRALRTTAPYAGESGDSNVIGSFVKPSLRAPAGLRRVEP